MTSSFQLPPRRDRFVNEYLHDMNATRAAIRAGYSPHTARQQGSRLLTDVDVNRAIAQGQRELAERTEANEAFIVAELVEIAVNGQKTSDRIRALELLGKRIGMWEPQEATNDSIPDTSMLKDWTIAQLVAGIDLMTREQKPPTTLIEGISHLSERDG
jgi:hypothetical protein